MPHEPNHSTSDQLESVRHDDSSGPFSATSAREEAVSAVRVDTVSTKFFKGLRVAIPWTVIVLAGGWCIAKMWLDLHDMKIAEAAQDTGIQKDKEEMQQQFRELKKAVSEFANDCKAHYEHISDKLDNLTQFRGRQ